MKIFHKGLILVAFPIACELVFVAILMVVSHQAENDLLREIHSKEVIYTTGVFGRHAGEGIAAVAAYSTSHSEFFRDRYLNSRRGLKRGLKELRRLMKKHGSKEQVELVEKISEDVKRGDQILDNAVDGIDKRIAGETGDFKFTGPLAMRTAQTMIDSLMRKLASIAQDETVVAEQYSKQGARSRQQVRGVLIAFVVFNICLAFFLVQWFSKSIVRRLNQVVENTRRVPRGEELSAPIGGGDEISELDLAFHEMVDELYKAQRMKQYLLSMVSHDLRSPLTSVQGLLTLMASGVFGELGDKATRRVQTAEAEVSRLINMTNDLLDVERLATGTLEMNLADASVREILEATRGSQETLAEQHQVILECNSPDISIEADQERLVQVMVNLVSNAIKYSPAGSRVSIAAGEEDGSVLFNVVDSGRGIPEEFKEKIFEKFQQVEDADSTEKGGKGLGLAICKSIVEAHGGEIGVESVYGQGSTFWFRLPGAASRIEQND